MIEVRLQRLEKYRYKYASDFTSHNDIGIGLLIDILKFDPNTKQRFKENLPSTEQKLFFGDLNYGYVGGERAIIGDQYDTEEKEFELDRTHLLELINKWEDLSNRDAKEIIVRRDGERFEIEGVFE
jgi:hypothetical protein